MSDEPKLRLPESAWPGVPERSSRRPDSRNAGTYLALFGIGLVTFFLIGMVALVLEQVRGLVLVFLGAIAFFAIHYLLWGWWLPKMMRKDEELE